MKPVQKPSLISHERWKQWIVIAALSLLLFVTLVPFLMTIFISQKSNAEIYTNFWAFPTEFHPEFFSQAFAQLDHYMLNSIMICIVTLIGVVGLSSLSGYVFARLRFPGKNLLYMMLLSLMMVPGILTLIPLFKWIHGMPLIGGNNIWGEGGSGLLNTWFALWLPYWSVGQLFGILLCRMYFESLPESLFEAARIDGAGELRVFTMIALPLSLPILATLAMMQFVGTYNDYIWPLVTLSSPEKQVFAVGITSFAAEGQLDMAPQMAGYMIGSIPLILLFSFGMKYYIEGITSGGLKA